MADNSPEQSLQSYFDDLLGMEMLDESPEPIQPKPAPEPKPAPPPRPVIEKPSLNRQRLQALLESAKSVPDAVIPEVASPPRQVATKTAPVTETRAKEAPPPVAPPSVAPTRVKAPTPAPVQTPAPPAEEVAAAPAVEENPFAWGANGRPRWAQDEFDVLLFSVSGLMLAVPLISLGQIQPITDELTPLFGQADWFMGLQPTSMGRIKTVNTALFVMPERYNERFLASARYVVSIDGLSWGLAVDTINQPIRLKPTDVKWRTERSKRPWLAGTVKQHMCVLIDVQMMGKILQDSDRAHSK